MRIIKGIIFSLLFVWIFIWLELLRYETLDNLKGGETANDYTDDLTNNLNNFFPELFTQIKRLKVLLADLAIARFYSVILILYLITVLFVEG